MGWESVGFALDGGQNRGDGSDADLRAEPFDKLRTALHRQAARVFGNQMNMRPLPLNRCPSKTFGLDADGLELAQHGGRKKDRLRNSSSGRTIVQYDARSGR